MSKKQDCIQDRIKDLSNIGESPETIAKELNVSVEFVIMVINDEVPF